jgi:hypothetical protein
MNGILRDEMAELALRKSARRPGMQRDLANGLEIPEIALRR